MTGRDRSRLMRAIRRDERYLRKVRMVETLMGVYRPLEEPSEWERRNIEGVRLPSLRELRHVREVEFNRMARGHGG